MVDIEERVTALEARVDQLAAECQHSTDVAVVAAREALTARQSHQHNVELLNALRTTQLAQDTVLAEHSRTLADQGRVQAEQSRTLDKHTEILGEHSQTLAEHSRILAEHSQTLDKHTKILERHTQILEDHTGRMDAIDSKLGILTVGMHTIESLLRRLTTESGLN